MAYEHEETDGSENTGQGPAVIQPMGTRFPLSIDQCADLENRFTYHPPKPTQPERYVEIRDAGRDFATLIAQCCPQSREQSLAITKIEEAVFWANAGIARNE